MKSKSFKVLVSLIAMIGLLVSLSYSVLALSITGISSVVNYDGSVSIKATLSGYTAGDNLTVKVEDTLANDTATGKIKYIDQMAPTLDAWGNYVLAFKLRDVNVNVGRDYLLTVGGKGISSVTKQKLFRIRQKTGTVAALSFVKAPNILRKGDSIKELLGVVAYDSTAKVVTLTNSDIAWSVVTDSTGLTISSTGELSGTLASGFTGTEFTISATSNSISVTKTIKVVDATGKIAVVNDSDLLKATSAISQTGSGTIGISKNSVTGNYVAKKPVVKNTEVSFSVPTITGTSVQYKTRFKKVGDTNFTEVSGQNSSFTPATAGVYVVEMLTYENANSTDFAADGEVKQTIYFRVVDSLTDASANVLVRGEAGTGETSFDVANISAEYSGGTLSINVVNIDAAKYEFKYFYLDADSGNNTKDAWVTLSDYKGASHSETRAGIATGDKVAVYVRLKGSTNPVEAYRIKTITIN